MFAAFVQEYPKTTLDHLPAAIQSWTHVLGVLCMIMLLIWGVHAFIRWTQGRGTGYFYGLTGRFADVDASQAWKARVFFLGVVVAVLGMAVMGTLTYLSDRLDVDPESLSSAAFIAFTIACIGAILAVSWEFLLDLETLRFRRIWALSRFSIKEAIRRKTLWAFCVILGLFLFGSWFMPISRPQDQWRSYIDLVFLVMTLLLLVTASVVSCFSLPADIRQQSIHTVVTKPVQRFEIVLGRIVGFTLLMTAVLVVVAHLSLLYIFRGLDPSTKENSMQARVPIHGELRFEELDSSGVWRPRDTGENVGREWDYRKHIRGGSTQEAVWIFQRLPADLKARERVRVEFTFDIFRTSKGGAEYQEGVSCQVMFRNRGKWDSNRHTEYREAKNPETGLPLTDFEKGKKYGYYELPGPINVVDYETMVVHFPGSVLEDMNDGLEIRVSCRSHAQYLGMARHDLYILADNNNFYLNYLKGVLGIWFVMVLVVALGVVFSTYLSAMIGLMNTWLLLLCGLPFIRQYIAKLASPVDTITNPGGGPLQAGWRLLHGENMVSQLERTTGVQAILAGDIAFQYGFKWFLNLPPDLGQYWNTLYVAEGFNVPGTELLASVVMLLGYLFPFLLAGYYLINVREVAQ